MSAGKLAPAFGGRERQSAGRPRTWPVAAGRAREFTYRAAPTGSKGRGPRTFPQDLKVHREAERGPPALSANGTSPDAAREAGLREGLALYEIT